MCHSGVEPPLVVANRSGAMLSPMCMLLNIKILTLRTLDAQAMRERIRETRHMWTYAYMEQYVTQKVLDTAGDPQLDVYRANDTICEAGNYTTVS